jgi:repressor LexA
MKVIDRLKQYIEFKGLILNAFDKTIGTSNGYIGKQIKNGASIGTDIIEKIICIYSDLNLEWLITGDGNMLKNKEEIIFKAIKVASHQKGVSLINMEVAAGFGNPGFNITEQDVQALYVVPDFSEVDFMIRVKGSSMYPKYSSGDIIACRKIRESKFIQWNKCYVIATQEQGVLVQRIRQSEKPNSLLAVSDNKEYQAFDIPLDEISGIALIVGVIRLE